MITQIEELAGIRFEHMEVPSARDVEAVKQQTLIKTSQKERVVQKLQEFISDNDPDVVFKQCAQEATEFLAVMQGNYQRAMAAALSYIKLNSHMKQPLSISNH